MSIPESCQGNDAPAGADRVGAEAVSLIHPRGRLVSIPIREGLPAESFPAYQCEISATRTELPSLAGESSGRTRSLTFLAIHTALTENPLATGCMESIALCFGTGIHEALGQTAFAPEPFEGVPRPTRNKPESKGTRKTSVADDLAAHFALGEEAHTAAPLRCNPSGTDRFLWISATFASRPAKAAFPASWSITSTKPVTRPRVW